MISIDDAVKMLNEMLALDPIACRTMLINAIPCNEDLADHPTIQVNTLEGGYTVRMMGIINGLFGINSDSSGKIAFVIEDNKLIRFEKHIVC